jgi:hypothetical protein
MSVHKEISAHSTKQHEILKQFLQLEQQREFYIDEAVSLCKQGKEFSTDRINTVTAQINNLARQGVVPQRKLVTVEMVKEYSSRLESKQ